MKQKLKDDLFWFMHDDICFLISWFKGTIVELKFSPAAINTSYKTNLPSVVLSLMSLFEQLRICKIIHTKKSESREEKHPNWFYLRTKICQKSQLRAKTQEAINPD